jgi:glycosyltransferase involved in cell wall biosynthesis
MKVLAITSELDGGGVDRLLYDYCNHLSGDVQFDFIVTSKIEGILEQPLKALGCKIFRVPQLKEDFKGHREQIKEIIEAGEYDIIHDHSGYKAWCNLTVAKKCGVKSRIAHSHLAFVNESFLGCIIRKISTIFTKFCATDLFACGNDAAKWMWGEKAFRKNKVYIMKNAVFADKFSFCAAKRNELRKELGLENKFVIGNVARITYQKNQEFLVDAFAEIKKTRDDAVLLLVGRGDAEEQIKKQVSDLGLNDSVIFTGVRNDVPDLLNVMDVFVLPSRFEGLPVTLIEIQANGLPGVISDTVTKEMQFSEEIIFLPLSESYEEWAKVILSNGRQASVNAIENTSYDLKLASKDLKNKYFSITGN